MYIRRNIRLRIIFNLAWRFLLPYMIYCAIIILIHIYVEHYHVKIYIPFMPISLIGIAVSFYLGFKNNQSYERLWEARKIWGQIVNASRTWGNQVMSLVIDPLSNEKYQASSTDQRELIRRHLAWINSLRVVLRSQSRFGPHHTKSFAPQLIVGEESQQSVTSNFLGEEQLAAINYDANVPVQLVRLQGEHLKHLFHNRQLTDFQQMQMMSTLDQLYESQGKCERIKTTPFPRQYAFYCQIFTWIFVLLLPFGLISQFESIKHQFVWLTIPFSGLIAWIFMTMEMVGDRSEDPFESFIHDVPMTSLCRDVEVDLLQMLGDKELPQLIDAIDDVLM
ncbi:MAG: hypothetical protein N2C12_04635 [Planctomycetales bacterium]